MNARISAFLVLSGMLMSGTCKKEGPDCHHNVTLKNESSDSVIVAYRAFYDEKCNLQGTVLAPKGTRSDALRTCWENRLSGGALYEVYVVSITGYNNPLVYYACDSVEFHNTILLQYALSLGALKAADFTLVYP